LAKFVLPQRQIHLDFHTGPMIPDVGTDFNASEFARTMKKAHVNSVTVFAKCHHGHLYFPTKHPARHPNLRKGLDLTGEQVEALHREGIRAPIYISVLCDEFAADTHPEWIARNVDGTNVSPKPLEPGWQILDMSSPYVDYLAEQTEEVLKRYKPVDGIFFDMCWDQPSVSNWAVEGMLKKGYDPEKEADRARYASEVSLSYMERYYKLVKKSAPNASVYFNARPMTKLPLDIKYLTHVEIEALPTGGWGYLYFPKNVRYARMFGKPYMGMTGRFHKSWADFGGLKPVAALKYEVCEMLSHGAQCSIGDQLHPRGRLDKAVYELIGRAYGYAEACEPWTDGATAVTEIGLLRVGGGYHDEPGGSNDGAVRMLTQLKLQFDVVTSETKLDRYKLLVLPDSVSVDKALVKKLRAFVKGGGSLLLSGTSGLDINLKPLLPEMGIAVHGESPFKTTYIRFGDAVSKDVPDTVHVMYERGIRMTAAKGAEALARVVEPYFDRNYQHFCSHAQTPNLPNASRYAAAIRKGRVITIPYPIFKAFGLHGNLPYRSLVRNCIDILLPGKLIEVSGPSTLEATVMRQKNRTVVHLLQFVAERRHNTDIIEDIIPVFDVPVTLSLNKKPHTVYLAPSKETLPFAYSEGRASLTVPKLEGHQMIVFE
jgi:hypothetical protein